MLRGSLAEAVIENPGGVCEAVAAATAAEGSDFADKKTWSAASKTDW